MNKMKNIVQGGEAKVLLRQNKETKNTGVDLIWRAENGSVMRTSPGKTGFTKSTQNTFKYTD